MIGETISHYRIIDKLGEGGMGVVYMAMDLDLDRSVALKFLPPEYTRAPDAKTRFIQEAKAAAALNHPNICTIHVVDEFDGQSFIVMECCEGETLKERIDRGPLPLVEVFDIARQVALGLAKAHEHDIVHRDIKPANVFVTNDGLVKILDFGLAKLTGPTQLTVPGMMMGTGHYMSPEQASGSEADRRSDLWSLGIVLYEMVTGRVPFGGDHAQAVSYAIQCTEPAPVAGLRTGVPIELERVIGKCLAKRPAERYQHAEDLAADLRHVGEQMAFSATGSNIEAAGERPDMGRWPWVAGIALTLLLLVAAGIRFLGTTSALDRATLPALAVLPFENLGEPEDAYFADGITDEILTRLSTLSGIVVIDRGSSFLVNGDGESIESIGDRLDVDYILRGAIRWDGSAGDDRRVRITPKLVAVEDSRSMWADVYEEEYERIFDLQTSIGLKVAEALEAALGTSVGEPSDRVPTSNMDAYDSYLSAKVIIQGTVDPERYAEAERLLQEAIRLDADFAGAHAWLSMLIMDKYHQSYDRTDAALANAKGAYEEALRLDPDLPEAHLARGRYYYYGLRDYGRALEALDRVLTLRPNDWSATHYTGLIQKRQGRFEEASTSFRLAQDLNPTNIRSVLEEAVVLRCLGRDEQVERVYLQAIANWPDQPGLYRALSVHYTKMDGDVRRARTLIEEAEARFGLEPFRGEWIRIFRFERKYEQALEVMRRHPGAGGVASGRYLTRADLYRGLGNAEAVRADADSARILLESAIADQPAEGWWHARLGLALAYLGRSEDAVDAGLKACSLMPLDRDAILGQAVIIELAKIYTICGEFESALQRLETVLPNSLFLSPKMLMHDPFWDPLRNESGLADLVADDRWR